MGEFLNVLLTCYYGFRLGVGMLNKGAMASAWISVQEQAAPPAFVLKPDCSVPLHVSLLLELRANKSLSE